jgi:hypothetical protein
MVVELKSLLAKQTCHRRGKVTIARLPKPADPCAPGPPVRRVAVPIDVLVSHLNISHPAGPQRLPHPLPVIIKMIKTLIARCVRLRPAHTKTGIQPISSHHPTAAQM